MLKLALLFTLAVLSAEAFAQWGSNDLSVLFPLPETLESNTLLSPKAGLLPLRMYKTLPKLVDFEDQDKLFNKLSVVALRIDPPKKEIRMVYQPLEVGFMPDDEGVKAMDMAIHVFYQLTDAEFSAFMANYYSLKTKFNISTPVVHGVNENMNTAYGKSFKDLAVAFTGEKRISKVTFMRLESIGGVWAFGGFNVKDGVMARFQIPRLRADLQMFTNVGRGSFISGKIQPAARGKDTFNNVIESLVKDASQSDLLVKEVRSAFRVEDPKVHTVDTMDCVSCHTAQLVRHWSFGKFPEILSGVNWPSALPTDGLMLNNLRAFGYHDRTPTINQRTVNETVEIVSKLNEDLPNVR